MNKLRKLNIVFIICFVIMITAPILCINTVNGKMSTSENRYLASFPKLFDETSGGIRKEFFGEFNTWLNDNIGFREFFVKLNSNLNYKILKTSPNDSVHIGKDGCFILGTII